MAPGELKILALVVTDLQKKNGLNPLKELFLALYCQSTTRGINFLRGINIWQLFRIIDATSDINSTQKVDESKNAWDFASEALTDFKILFSEVQYTLDLRKILGVNQIFLKSRLFLISNKTK